MRFFLIEQKDGLVNIPGPMLMSGSVSMTGPVSAPNLDYTEITALVAALALKLDVSAYTAADVLAKLLTVDGAGSGLDADLLDGQSSAAFLSAASYTAADVLAKLLTVDGAGSLLDADFLDGLSSAAFAAAAHVHAQADITGLAASLALKLDAASYTAADVLAKLLTVDGAASGIDADLLDGISSAGFLQTSTYEALTPTWANTHTFSNVVVTPGVNGATTLQLQIAGTAQQYMTATQNAWALGTTVPSTSTTRHVFGVSGNQGIEIAALAGSPRWVAKRYNGAYAAPTKTVNTNTLALFRVEGYQETTGAFVAISTFDVVATEDFTSTANGQKITFRSVATGSATVNNSLILQGTQTQFHPGSVTTPGAVFQGDLTSGFYSIGASNIGISINTAKVFDCSTTAATVTTVDLKLASVGKGIYIKEGTNACMGVATLVLGTVVVSTTKVTASSRIQLTAQSLGTITVPSALAVSARTAGTSFTILASQLTDTSVVAWEITEPA